MNEFRSPKLSSPQTAQWVRAAIEFIVLIIVVWVFVQYLLLPQRKNYIQSIDLLKQIDNQKTLLAEQANTLDFLSKTLQDYPNSVTQADTVLPTDSTPSSVYHLLDELVKQTGLLGAEIQLEANNPAVISPNTDQTSKNNNHTLQILNFKIDGLGSTAQIQNLLQLLETTPRILAVEGLEITSQTTGQLKFSIKAKTYAYPETSSDKTLNAP